VTEGLVCKSTSVSL